jgi:hypothetical protein
MFCTIADKKDVPAGAKTLRMVRLMDGRDISCGNLTEGLYYPVAAELPNGTIMIRDNGGRNLIVREKFFKEV